MIEQLLAGVVLGVELLGAGLIVLAVVTGVVEIARAAIGARGHDVTTVIRLDLAQRLVLALEFLIAADILKTITTPTLEGMALLGSIIAIRTVLTLSIAFELRREVPVSAQHDAASVAG